MTQKGITIALPSGKSMEQQIIDLLTRAHIKVHRAHPRMVTASVSGLPGVTNAIFFKPTQIAKIVESGQVRLGFTGHDIVLESGAEVVTFAELNISRATNGPTKCVLFTNAADPIARPIQDGDPVYVEYPKEAQLYFDRRGIRPNIRKCDGGAEARVVASRERCWGIALTETGASLAVNGLKIVDTVFESKTVLIGTSLSQDGETREIGLFLGKKLQGVLAARDKVYLVMNAPVKSADSIRRYLVDANATMRGPTVSPLYKQSSFCAIATVVPASQLNEIEQALENLGASDFVELDPAAML